TPTVSRMVAAKRQELSYPLRWYSIANLFRYERPQRGRLREHWQLNVDLFGTQSLYADAEILGVAYGLMKAFGAETEDFVIKVGSRIWLNQLIEDLKLNDARAQKLRRLLDAKGKISTEEFHQGL